MNPRVTFDLGTYSMCLNLQHVIAIYTNDGGEVTFYLDNGHVIPLDFIDVDPESEDGKVLSALEERFRILGEE